MGNVSSSNLIILRFEVYRLNLRTSFDLIKSNRTSKGHLYPVKLFGAETVG